MTISAEPIVSFYELAEDGSKHRLDLPGESRLSRGESSLAQHLPREGERLRIYNESSRSLQGEYVVVCVSHDLTYHSGGLGGHYIQIGLKMSELAPQ